MPLILDIQQQRPATDLADALRAVLIAAFNDINRAKTQANANRYDVVVGLPRRNVELQRAIQAVTNSGIQSEVLNALQEKIRGGPTLAEINAFIIQFDDLADQIITGFGNFVPTLNGQSRVIEFVTPLSANQQTALIDQINAVIATTG